MQKKKKQDHSKRSHNDEERDGTQLKYVLLFFRRPSAGNGTDVERSIASPIDILLPPLIGVGLSIIVLVAPADALLGKGSPC